MSPVGSLTRPNPVGLSDAELMEATLKGSIDALGELYDRYCARALRIARSVCPDHDVAEDAVQEAFVSIFKNRMAYQAGRGTVAAWILTLVLHRAIDVSRAHARHASRRVSDATLGLRHAPGDVAGEACTRIETVHMRTALAALPDPQREAIILAYYGGLTHTEISERLDLPFGTVKGRIRLGMDSLRLASEPAGTDQDA